MLATGHITRRSRFLRTLIQEQYGDRLRKCILTGPYTPTMVTTPAVPATEDSPEVPAKTSVETIRSYSTVECMSEQLKKCGSHRDVNNKVKSLNIPDVKTNLFWDDPEQAVRKDKDMQKNLALHVQSTVKKLYSTNLPTTTSELPQNTRTRMLILLQEETVGGPVVQQSGIQCFNCKEFGHYAKECRKPKRVKDSTYHKEKMLLCKQAEKGVQLQAEQSDWLADTDEEIDEHELESAHYSYIA
ncbi:retrovirus-related pol polyprotein from transposon TNT 1-94 [Tanacetum coccineum]